MPRLQLYAHPDGRSVLHVGGFSWLAMLALPVWALRRDLRRLAALALPLLLVPGPLLLALGVSEFVTLLSAWALMVGYGALAPRLHVLWMRRTGWVVLAEEPAATGTGPRA